MKDLVRENNDRKSMAKSEEERAKADDIRRQRDRLWNLAGACSWRPCQLGCVNRDVPASLSCWHWGCVLVAGWDGITVKARFLYR